MAGRKRKEGTAEQVQLRLSESEWASLEQIADNLRGDRGAVVSSVLAWFLRQNSRVHSSILLRRGQDMHTSFARDPERYDEATTDHSPIRVFPEEGRSVPVLEPRRAKKGA